MVNSGDLALLRRPVWEIGSGSIGFVIGELAHQGLSDPAYGAVVIGYSNGGDMAMLFVTEHPEKVQIVLTLDNCRMPLPRFRKPKVCSLRSSDHAADPGVLPSPTDQAELGMLIIAVPVKHDDMWDGATADQQETMLAASILALMPNVKRPLLGAARRGVNVLDWVV